MGYIGIRLFISFVTVCEFCYMEGQADLVSRVRMGTTRVTMTMAYRGY